MRAFVILMLVAAVLPAAEPEITPEIAERLAAAEAAGKEDPARAVKLLDSPEGPAEWFALGAWQWRAGDPAGAAASFRRAVDVMPDFHRARRQLAAVLIEREEWEAAAGELRKLLDRGASGRGELWQSLAHAYLAAGRPEAAAAAAGRALPWRPDDPELRRLHIAALAEAGDFSTAARLAGAELKREPGRAEYWRVLAKADLEAGRQLDALVRLETMHRLGQLDAHLLFSLGDLLLVRGLPREAAVRYREAAAEGSPERLLEAIRMLAAQGEAAAAADLLPLLPREMRESLAVRRIEADLAREAGRFEDALTRYQELVRERPTDGQLLLALGDLERRTGDSRAAAATYERAARLDPAIRREVLLRQADLAVSHGDYAAAAERVSQALALAPDPALERYLRQLRAVR